MKLIFSNEDKLIVDKFVTSSIIKVVRTDRERERGSKSVNRIKGKVANAIKWDENSSRACKNVCLCLIFN